MDYIKKVVSLIKQNLTKFFLFLLLIPIFILVLFPLGDLSGLITNQVAKATKNQVYLNFEDMSLGLLPVGIQLFNVEIITKNTPSLKAGELTISLPIAKLLSLKYGAKINLEDFFGGSVRLSFEVGKPDEKNKVLHKVSYLDIKNLNLKKLTKTFPVGPTKLSGNISAQIQDVTFDPSLSVQPTAEFNLNSNRIQLTQPTVIIPNLGPLRLPDLVFTKFKIKGRMMDGQVYFEESFVGAEQDKFQVKYRGKFNLTLTKLGPRTIPVISNIDIRVFIKSHTSVNSEISIISFLDGYKASQQVPNYTQYSFRMFGPTTNSIQMRKSNF